MDMRNRASYNQLLDADGWQADDENTWQAVAGDVMPPGNNGVITGPELAASQAGGDEPARLTDQFGLYTENEYKPHPATRTQVEDVAVEATTIRAVGPSSTGPAEPPSGVPTDSLEALGEALDDPFETADD